MAKAKALEVGDRAPAFQLQSTSGKAVALADFAGKKVVLYFYPKDDTPGCTVEACDFRDEHRALQAAGAVVLGVSKDTLASHGKFRAKYELPFDLLSDPDNAVAKRFGAFGTKVMYGKEVQGTIRSTFVIDEAGRIAARWSPVKVEGHAAAVLAALGGAARADAAAEKGAQAKQAASKQAGTKKAASRKTPAKKASTKKAPATRAARKPGA